MENEAPKQEVFNEELRQMAKKERFKLGSEYRIVLLDHFSSESKSPEQAIKIKVEIVCWGRCVGISKDYVLLSYFWENDTSENNDNVSIMRKCILNSREIK